MKRSLRFLNVVRYICGISYLISLIALGILMIIDHHGSQQLMGVEVLCAITMLATGVSYAASNDAYRTLKKGYGEPPAQPPDPSEPLSAEEMAKIQGINELPGGPYAA